MDISDVPDLQITLKDTTVFWVGYSLKRTPISFRPNLLTIERDKLVRFAWDIMHLLFSDQRPHPLELATSSRNLAEKLHKWYICLPAELRYSKSMPAGLFEFQYEAGMQLVVLRIWLTLSQCTVSLRSNASVRPD